MTTGLTGQKDEQEAPIAQQDNPPNGGTAGGGNALAAMRLRVNELSEQLQTLEQLRPVLTKLQERAESIEAMQRQTGERLLGTSEAADKLESDLDGLRHSVEMAQSLTGEIKTVEHLIPDTHSRLDDLKRFAARVAEQMEEMQGHEKVLAHTLKLARRAESVVSAIDGIEDRQRDQTEACDRIESALISLHGDLTERTDKMRERLDELDDTERTTLEEFGALRAEVETALERVTTSSRDFEKIGGQVDEMRELVGGLEEQFAALSETGHVVERVRGEVDTLAARLLGIAEGTENLAELETRLSQVHTVNADLRARTVELADRYQEIEEGTRTAVEELREVRTGAATSAKVVEESRRDLDAIRRGIEAAMAEVSELDSRLGAFEASKELVAEIQIQADDLSRRMRILVSEDGKIAQCETRLADLKAFQTELLDQSARIAERQEQLDRGAGTARKLLSGLSDDVQENVAQVAIVSGSVDDVRNRVDELHQAFEEVETRLDRLGQTRQQLDEVDTKASRLSERLLDLADGEGGLTELQERLNEFQAEQADLLVRWQAVVTRQQEAESGAEAVRRELAGIHAEIGKTEARVGDTHGEIDAANERIETLVQNIADWESKLAGLAESREAIVDMRHEADDLGARLAAIGDDCEEVRRNAARLRRFGREIDRIGGIVKKVEERVVQIEEARAELDNVTGKIDELKQTSDSTQTALKQARSVNEEIARMRDDQTSTEKWFGELTESLESLHRRADELNELAPKVRTVRAEAERINAAAAAIETRKEYLDEIDRRLAELASLGQRLENGETGPFARAGSRLNGETRWHFDANVGIDRKTWEFGLQFRFAGRWKRGIAIWFGPLRAFIGWERRAGWQDTRQPVRGEA